MERVVLTPPTSSVFVDERRSAVARVDTLVELVERWRAEFTIEEEADFRVVQVVGLHHLIVHVLVDVEIFALEHYPVQFVLLLQAEIIH